MRIPRFTSVRLTQIRVAHFSRPISSRSSSISPCRETSRDSNSISTPPIPESTPAPAPAPAATQDPESIQALPKYLPYTYSLALKTALITGASRGIGLSIAQRFAREGVRCILAGRNEAALEDVRAQLPAFGGQGTHAVVVGNVGDKGFWDRVGKKNNVDILVNAAGVTHYSPLFVTSQESLDDMLRTNLMGTMMACKEVGKSMIKRKQGGVIINVASLLGVKGGQGSTAYAASKAGVIGLTRALAAEAGPKNIRVNVIVPGYIETDMTSAMAPEAHSEALNAIPLKRFGQPDEIADAAVFLATNKYASNCVLNLDGGLSAM